MPASESWVTASATARATGATGSPVTSWDLGGVCVRTIRTSPVERSRRVPGTRTSMCERASSGGAELNRYRASAASPVIMASPPRRPAYSSAACSRSSLVAGPGWSRNTPGRICCQGRSAASEAVTPCSRSWARVSTRGRLPVRWARGRGALWFMTR